MKSRVAVGDRVSVNLSVRQISGKVIDAYPYNNIPSKGEKMTTPEALLIELEDGGRILRLSNAVKLAK